jgi:peroxiredoxin
LLVYIGLRKSAASIQPTATQNEIDRLPAVEIVDDTGKRIGLDGLTGRVVLVQFVNPKIATQINAVSRAVAAFEASQVSFVLITKDSHELRTRLPSLPANVSVVQDHNAELRHTFNVPACCERRFIFNSKGEIQYKDYYYEADLRPRLHSLIDTAPEDFPPALTGALESIKTGRFASLRKQTRRSQSGKAVVILFDSISTSCPSGELVKSLGRFAAAHKDFPVIAVLPKDYTATDVENLKANLQVEFPIEQADTELAERWKELLSVFGESRMNGSVVVWIAVTFRG